MSTVTDGPRSEILSHPVVSPRWNPSESRSIRVTVRYPASKGYVAYRLADDAPGRSITATMTGSGDAMDAHFLLPEGVETAKSVERDGVAAPFAVSRVQASTYVDLKLGRGVGTVRIRY